MLLPNRNASTDAYRYGFQGQEKDDEIKGGGNSINFRYRMHDPRVGRFFAVDPLSHAYPYYTPYQFAGNKVIAYSELEGLEEDYEPIPDPEEDPVLNHTSRKVNLDLNKRHYINVMNCHQSTEILEGAMKETATAGLLGGVIFLDIFVTKGRISAGLAAGDFSRAMSKSEEAVKAEQSGDFQRASVLYNEAGELSKGAIFELGAGIGGYYFGKLYTATSKLKLWSSIDESVGFYAGNPEATFYDINLVAGGARPRAGVALTDESGVLVFEINIPKDLQGQGILSEIVPKAIADYAPSKIKGWWKTSSNYDGGISTNLKSFKENIENGMSLEKAALNTPSGKVMSANGFDGVPEIIKNTDDEVIIHFTRKEQ